MVSGLAKEPQGLLSLTAQNDELSRLLLRNDVTEYIIQQIQERLPKLELQEAIEKGYLRRASELITDGF